jgi:hypothetical protein
MTAALRHAYKWRLEPSSSRATVIKEPGINPIKRDKTRETREDSDITIPGGFPREERSLDIPLPEGPPQQYIYLPSIARVLNSPLSPTQPESRSALKVQPQRELVAFL